MNNVIVTLKERFSSEIVIDQNVYLKNNQLDIIPDMVIDRRGCKYCNMYYIDNRQIIIIIMDILVVKNQSEAFFLINLL